jgi:hypothetical protein
MTRAEINAIAKEREFTVLFADGFDDAIVGLVMRFGFESPIVLYDRKKCIEILTVRDGMDEEGAEEFFQFNVEGAWVGAETPCFLVHWDV